MEISNIAIINTFRNVISQNKTKLPKLYSINQNNKV